MPGEYEGTGDTVLILHGGKPDIAHIAGNKEGRHFHVWAYGTEDIDLLVNTSDPYVGTVLMPPSTVILEIGAEGEWLIEIEAR